MADVPGRTRVLYLTHHLPWPPMSGGRLREAELLSRLVDTFSIELVAVSKVPDFDARHLPEATRLGCGARIFPTDPSAPPGNSALVRRHWSPQARRYLAAYDAGEEDLVVHVEGHYLVNLLPPRLRTRALVVDHNIESGLCRQRAGLVSTEHDRRRLFLESELTEQAERSAWTSAAMVGTVTDEDAHAVRMAAPLAEVRVIGDGADHLTRRADTQPGADRTHLLFVANLAYQPNEDAARALVDQVFPAVLRRCPDATLTVVGSSPPAWLSDMGRKDRRIRVTGWVPDVSRWLDVAEVVVCPLRIGGGVKVKILEALARGCAIVTTPVGMQGLRYLPRDSVMECQDLDAVADACVALLKSPARRNQIRTRAALAATRLPTWDQAAAELAAAWTSLASAVPRTAITAGS